MAIYHFSIKTISRSDGRSAVAAAAYRSGTKLEDEFYGLTHDYRKKTGVELSKIYTPDDCDPNLKNRQNLWNSAEKSEKRKRSTVAREFEIAFPCELTKIQREEMLDDFCKKIVARHSVVVDASIHAPHTKSGTDERNFHAHILLTTRRATKSGLGEKTRELDKKTSGEVQWWRKSFAEIANHYLEKSGHITRVDHRSHADRGIDIEPQVHEGPTATALRRKGLINEIITSNNLIKERNILRLERSKKINTLTSMNEEIGISERKLEQLESKKNELLKTYQDFWSFQDKYRNFFEAYNEATTLEDQANVVEEHHFVEEISRFENSCRFLKDKNIEFIRPPTSIFSIFSKKNQQEIAITFDELQGLKPFFANVLKYIQLNKQLEKQRLKKDEIDKKRAADKDLKLKNEELERNLAVQAYFQKYDKTGLKRDFVNAFRYPHAGISNIELMTQFQAQKFVDKDLKGFRDHTIEKYKEINNLIPKLNIQELKIIEKIIETDLSVTGVNISDVLDKTVLILKERHEKIELPIVKQPDKTPILSKNITSEIDFDF